MNKSKEDAQKRLNDALLVLRKIRVGILSPADRHTSALQALALHDTVFIDPGATYPAVVVSANEEVENQLANSTADRLADPKVIAGNGVDFIRIKKPRNRYQPNPPPTVKAAEERLRKCGANNRATNPAVFIAGLHQRLKEQHILRGFYENIELRVNRFRAHQATTSYLHRAVNRIYSHFKTDRKPQPQLVVFFGTWGLDKNDPYYSHSKPSRELRKLMQKDPRFILFDVPEYYTSSTCLSCFGHVVPDTFRYRDGRPAPRDLRVCIGSCYVKRKDGSVGHRYWNRDVLGAMNIGRNGLSMVHLGKWDEHFDKLRPEGEWKKEEKEALKSFRS